MGINFTIMKYEYQIKTVSFDLSSNKKLVEWMNEFGKDG